MTTYPLGDTPTAAETGGAPLRERIVLATIGSAPKGFRAVWTGEKRPPKKGEWYLSGSPVDAYRARNDLTSAFHIAKLVRVKKVPAHYEIDPS